MVRFFAGSLLLGGAYLATKRREIGKSHNFKGRNVLITGGATEVGQATIKKFLEAGAKVQVVEKNKEDLSQLLQDYPTITAAAVNFKDEGVEVVSAAQFGPVHHLVNIVDIEGQPVNPWETSPEQIHRLRLHFSNTYFLGIFGLIEAVSKVGALSSKDGTVVSMVSVVSIHSSSRFLYLWNVEKLF